MPFATIYCCISDICSAIKKLSRYCYVIRMKKKGK